jgi:hypothetical protein
MAPASGGATGPSNGVVPPGGGGGAGPVKGEVPSLAGVPWEGFMAAIVDSKLGGGNGGEVAWDICGDRAGYPGGAARSRSSETFGNCGAFPMASGELAKASGPEAPPPGAAPG